jgi:hypothetical protein
VFDHWELVAGAVMGSAFIVLGAIVRSGHYRVGVYRAYLRPDLPSYQRNAIFALLPVGVAFVCITTGAGLMQVHGTLQSGSDPDPLTNALMLVGFVTLITGLWWTWRPPGWAKPRWLRKLEQAEQSAQGLADLSAERRG